MIRGVLWTAFALMTAVNAGLVAKYHLDNRFLYAWSLQYVDEDDTPSEKVVGLARGFRVLRNQERAEPVEGIDHDHRVMASFGPLSLTPREVVEIGGPCESKSRLMRTLLHLHGIDSRRVLLKDQASHTISEADVEGGAKMVVDPLYGLYYPKPGGGATTRWRRSPRTIARSSVRASRRSWRTRSRDPTPTTPPRRRISTSSPTPTRRSRSPGSATPSPGPWPTMPWSP